MSAPSARQHRGRTDDLAPADDPSPAADLLPAQTPPHIAAWVRADRRLDLATMREQLAGDVVLVSPLTDQFRFEGPDEVMAVFASAFEVLEDIVIHRVTGTDRDWVIHGLNTLNGANLEEIQWLRTDAAGRICRITLFIRPAPAALAMLAAIGPKLAARAVLPRAAAISAAAVAPVAFVLRQVERRLMPHLGPRR